MKPGRLARTLVLLVLVPVAGCGSAPPSPGPVPPPAAPPPTASPSPPAPPTAPPAPTPSFDTTLQEIKRALGAGDFARADEEVRRAATLAGDDVHRKQRVAYYEATLHAYRGEYAQAAAALDAIVPELARHPEEPLEFWTHNALMMLRQAQGDVPGAIVECERMTAAGRRGTWAPADERERLVAMKDAWHRAYLFRMSAARETGARRASLLRDAEAARRAYTALARSLPDFQDSIAVLDGYFAALGADRAAALAAARKVHVEENDDLEDLYLAVVAFDAGGDSKSAARVREKMRASGDVYLARPLMLDWLERDLAADRGAIRFTPRHPTAAP